MFFSPQHTRTNALIQRFLLLASAALIVGGTGFLSGCATQPPKISQQKFISHIFDNDNKQFTFLAFTANNDHQDDNTIVFTGINTGSSSRDEAIRQRQSFKKQQKNDQSLEQQAIAALELQLQKNVYCREGYTLLERQISHERTLLRGECQELATDQDRQNFPNTRSSTVKQSTYSTFEMLANPEPKDADSQ
jgi:hypothetical protein